MAQDAAVSASAAFPRGPAKSPRRPRRSASTSEAEKYRPGTSDVGQPNQNTKTVL
jgi:hypothetical protein